MYLIDTNVLSELRKGDRRADRNVLGWAGSVAAEMRHLSAITVLGGRRPARETMTVVTRNVRDFAPMHVATLNTWQA